MGGNYASSFKIKIVLICFIFYLIYILANQQQSTDDCIHNPKHAAFKHRLPKDPFQITDWTPISTNSTFAVFTGFPGSGLNLMKVIIDAHPNLWCTENNYYGSQIINKLVRSFSNKMEAVRLHEAGITEGVRNNATSKLFMELFSVGPRNRNTLPGKNVYCSVHALLGLKMKYLANLLPNVKFILMVRDGRQVADSILSGSIELPTSIKLGTWNAMVTEWQKHNHDMLKECDEVGSDTCIKVRYEDVIVSPNSTLHGIMKYIGMPWSENLLHHQDFVGTEIHLNRLHPQTKKLVKPINTKSLWSTKSRPSISSMDQSLLKTLNYLNIQRASDFGEVDPIVKANDEMISQNPSMFDITKWQDDYHSEFIISPLAARKQIVDSFIDKNKEP